MEERKVRYVDKTDCKSVFEKGNSTEIISLGNLTKEACELAEANGLGLLKTRQGAYRVIKENGLGAYRDILGSLDEADKFFKNLEGHKVTRY